MNNSNMWKIKSACLLAISEFGPRCSKFALPNLFKMLKDSPINKQTIAEVIVRYLI